MSTSHTYVTRTGPLGELLLRRRLRLCPVLVALMRKYMEGGALDSLLYTTKWLPTTKQALQMSRDVADAMVYLHHNPDGEGKPISEPTAAEQPSRR